MTENFSSERLANTSAQPKASVIRAEVLCWWLCMLVTLRLVVMPRASTIHDVARVGWRDHPYAASRIGQATPSRGDRGGP